MPHLSPTPATRAAAAAAILLGALLFQPAQADGLLGLYVGGAVGEAQITAKADANNFKANDLAFKLMVGLRPIPLVGAELDYIDFGHPNGTVSQLSANASLQGVAAFGMLYAPIPVVDLYAKLGVASLESKVNGYFPSGNNVCSPGVPCGTAAFSLNHTDAGVAGGVGVQYKFGAFGVRAEYERFQSSSASPGLFSAGINWTFL